MDRNTPLSWYNMARRDRKNYEEWKRFQTLNAPRPLASVGLTSYIIALTVAKESYLHPKDTR